MNQLILSTLGDGDAESVDGYQTDVLTYDTNTGVIEKAPPSASAELMPSQARYHSLVIEYFIL